HPSFPDLLRQLTARDAKLLILAAQMQLAIRSTVPYEPVKIFELRGRSVECGFDSDDAGEGDFRVSGDTLVRLRLLETRDVREQRGDTSSQSAAYIMTNLGWAFLRAVGMRPETFAPRRVR